MLTSDGLTQAQFVFLWRDAMFGAAPAERARLTLELGRTMVREGGDAGVLLIAVVEGRDDPLLVLPLAGLPVRGAALRDAVVARLGELGASEAYVLFTVRTSGAAGVVSNLLACWGETVGGSEVAWMMPFRVSAGQVEEAAALEAPDARATRFSAELAGLLPPRH